MKKLLASFLGLSLVFPVLGQGEEPTSSGKYAITERGPHHRVLLSLTTVTNAGGKMSLQTHSSYTELETSMHFDRGGQWIETKAEIELVADGASAINGPHKVFFHRTSTRSELSTSRRRMESGCTAAFWG